MRRRVEVVFNPAAGRPGRRGRLDRVLRELAGLGCAVRLRETTAPGDAEAIARAVAGSAAEVVVAAGGDGTVNEVINGLRPGAPPLAVIPLGTANVLAVEIGLPREAGALAGLIARGPVRGLWPGEVNGRRFAMMAGIGFDARVVAAVRPALKRRLGRYAYVATAAWCCAYGGRAVYDVEADGVRYAGASAIVTRGRHYGGGFLLAPQASLFEPRLDLLLFASARPVDVVRSAAALARGRLARDANVRLIRAREVRVTGPGNETVQCDGGTACRLPATLTIAKEPIALVTREEEPVPMPNVTNLHPWPREFERRTAGPAGWPRPLAGVARLVAAVAREYDARCGARELREREAFVLRDVGIRRGEIERVVRSGQDRP